MFEYLPRVTEENLEVVLQKEMDYFTELLRRGTEGKKTLDEAIDSMCEELVHTNPYLVKAIRATAYAVAGELEDDVETELAWGAGIVTVPGVLAVLRLVDRALQSQLLEAELSKKSTSKK